MKIRLYKYLDGRSNFEKIKSEIQSAKRFGLTGGNFQTIIDALPFDHNSERFKDILEIIKGLLNEQ